MSEQKVYCRRYKKDMPALSEAPLKGAIGELILANVSALAWDEWVEAQMKIINEDRLDLSDEKSQRKLFDAMCEFLDISDLIEDL